MADLRGADHVFVTNSVMGAVPAVSLDDVRLGYDAALRDRLTRTVFAENQPNAGQPGGSVDRRARGAGGR